LVVEEGILFFGNDKGRRKEIGAGDLVVLEKELDAVGRKLIVFVPKNRTPIEASCRVKGVIYK